MSYFPTKSAPTANYPAAWDTDSNLSAKNFLGGLTSTATAAGTTTLTVSSNYQQVFTGSTTQTVTLPVASTLVNGQGFLIINQSTGVVTVQTSGSNTIQALAAGTSLILQCINTAGGTGTASWNWTYLPTNGGSVAPTVQKFTSGSGTYTTPANVAFIRVRMVGGGGGGAGSGTASGSSAGDGGDTTFGTSLLTAARGIKGTQPDGGTGGAATVNSPAIGTGIAGGRGSGGANLASGPGGDGGNNALGGAGGGGAFYSGSGSAGYAAAANSGGGGGGGGSNAASGQLAGGGGGAGGFIDAIISSPSATYSYAVGSAGTAGGAGTSGQAGGAGAAGYIEVTEYYANGAIGTATNITATSNSTLTSLTATAGVDIKGTNTNDNAASGDIGEAVRATGSGNWATSTQYFDIASISLTAGDWDVTGIARFGLGAASSISQTLVGIGTASGNNGAGLSAGDSAISCFSATGASDAGGSIPGYRISLSTTTTIYLKGQGVYSGGAPTYTGRISARRVR